MKITINGSIKTIYGIAAKTIRAQPGYDGSGEYSLCKTKLGGVRLYKNVGGRLMDASCQDINDDQVVNLLD